MQEFVLGGGCFWCIDAVFRGLRGVDSVVSGYSGGSESHPNYYQVASGGTGHAEVVKVRFDTSILPASVLLDIFFLIHDPTTLDQQGADIGPQYRSVMMAENSQQRNEFSAAIERAQEVWDKRVVTAIEPLDEFYPAEDEHQDYFNKQPASGYCSIVIQPKIVKARASYREWFASPTVAG